MVASDHCDIFSANVGVYASVVPPVCKPWVVFGMLFECSTKVPSNLQDVLSALHANACKERFMLKTGHVLQFGRIAHWVWKRKADCSPPKAGTHRTRLTWKERDKRMSIEERSKLHE